MKSMNLFGNTKPKETAKPKKKPYTEDFKKKAIKLAYQFGVTKAAEELGISTSSIYSWKKNVNLIFELEGKTYFLNVNSSEEREIIKAEVNSNSVAKYDWFKEETGENHWVFYNTEMYEICSFCNVVYLHYKEDCDLNPVIPINATSCYRMFYDCKALTKLDLSDFNTSNVINMHNMFSGCDSLIHLDLSNFDTSQVTSMCDMFSRCEAVTQLDLSSFNTSKVTDMSGMFWGCEALTKLDLSNFDTSSIHYVKKMFCYCYNLTTIYISNEWNTGSIDRFDDMLSHCFATIELK